MEEKCAVVDEIENEEGIVDIKYVYKNQELDGSWSGDKILDFCKTMIGEIIEKLAKELNGDVLTTVAILIILNLHCQDDADEIFLLVNKAKSFLFQHAVDFEKVMKELGINEVIC